MTVPGSNVLRAALSRLGKQSVLYFATTSRTTDARGVDVSAYAPPVTITGSVQPVGLKNYQYQGLDLNKRYVTLWTDQNVQPFARDTSGDVFNWQGQSWQVMNDDDWESQDGWKKVMAVAVGAPLPYDPGYFAFGDQRSNFANGNFYAG